MRTQDLDIPDNDSTVSNRRLGDRCTTMFQYWVVDSSTRLGTDVRVATKDVRVTNRDSVKTVKITVMFVKSMIQRWETKILFFLLNWGLYKVADSCLGSSAWNLSFFQSFIFR